MKKYILLLLIVLSLGSCKYQTANGAWRPKHLGFHIRPDLKSLDDLDSIPFEINMIFHEYDDEAEDTTRIIFIFSKDGRFVMTYERNVTDHSDTIRIDAASIAGVLTSDSSHCDTILPTLVDPVNETSGILGSLEMSSPISTPSPCTRLQIDLNPLAIKTSAKILVIATDTRGVLGAPFHKIKSPQTMAMQAFHP